MMMLTFPVLDQKDTFWANLVQNIFSALDWKHPFWKEVSLPPKKKIKTAFLCKIGIKTVSLS